ncbi:MAG: phosphate acyltransferase PlsX [Bacteroidia bacterium]|nr:phosphate acyltransferase PlsX [Bacteroidia bacterium]NNC84819.1 phosphate acyltransferase PlsX [Bacteroidia bacterium]NNM16377.1 phosphate acyltransferase PlsX [Bacteroidia bacterium]
MKIGVDIMGGDHAPKETTLGAIQAQKELPSDFRLVLFGDENAIQQILKEEGADASLFDIVHSTEVLEMSENPTKAIQQKPNSSMSLGFQHLAAKKIDGFCSAGNSGAMLVGAMFSVRTIPGILRPTISTVVPKESGGKGVLVDVGANADCKPEHLQQFALLGSLLAQHVFHMDEPKVGLMNIGEEEKKGNILSQSAHKLLAENKQVNFIGNIEGRDLFNDKADVIVCDGFTGNIILKLAESFYDLLKKRDMTNDYFERFNFENTGGTPILGVNAPVVVGHGISKSKAIKNMILLTKGVAEVGLIDKITKASQLTTVN